MNRLILLAVAALLSACGPTLASDGNIYIAPSPHAPGWARIDPASWSPNKAATAAELVGALLVNPLESLIGRPDVKIHIWKNEQTLRAAVKALNFPDDRIRSEETVIAMKQVRKGWAVTEVWKRWVCRRDNNSGKWTSKPCR